MKDTISIPDSYRARFANIPSQLFAYLDRLLKMSSQRSQFHQAMVNHPDKTFEALDRLFAMGSEIAGLPPYELLKGLDFNRNDLSPERIESLLGELRTIPFLENNGFTHIIPIRATSKRSPDFSARRNNSTYLIEVATSIHFAPRTFHNSIVKWVTGRLRKDDKLSQMNSSSSGTRKLFVCILNSAGAVALNERSDFLEVLKQVWEEIGSIQYLHMAIVTGRSSLREGLDDCVYPSIDGQ